MTREGKQKIDDYLGRLRHKLRGLRTDDVREIVEELRSYILDKAARNGEVTDAGVAAALDALGSLEKLASEYMTDNLLARAEVSRVPWRILYGLFRWASLSVAGFFVLLGSILGYFLGTACMLVAVLKPFLPETAGLWVTAKNTGDFETSLRLGFGSAPVGGHEVLGWWIIPLGLIVGCAMVMVTTLLVLWCVRQYRRSHLLP